MKVSSIPNYNIQKQLPSNNKVSFKQLPVAQLTKPAINLSNPATKKVFIRLAEILGLSAIINWANHLNKQDDNTANLIKAFDEIEAQSESKANQYLLDISTMDKYLETSAKADEIESIIKTKGMNTCGETLNIIENTEIKESADLLLNNQTRDIYISNRVEKALASLIKQAETISKSSEEQKEKIISTLETKISSLARQLQELRTNENASDFISKLENIAKMQSILAIMQNSKAEIKTNDTEKTISEDTPVAETADEIKDEISDGQNNGLKILGKIDLSQFERKSQKTKETAQLPNFKTKEIIITPKNKKFIETFQNAFTEKKGLIPTEAYGDKIDFIKEIYDSYGKKNNVKESLLNVLVKEDMNKYLEKYQSFLNEDSDNIDFFNFFKMEKLKETEGGNLTKEEFDQISHYKDLVVKYYQAYPDDGRLLLCFKDGEPVANRLKYIMDFHKIAFNVTNNSNEEPFREPIEVGEVKNELITRLCDNPDDYEKTLKYLGIDDVSEIAIQVKAGNIEEAEAIAEDMLFDPEIEANLNRLTSLLNNEKFTNFFASTHSRMRLIERFVLTNFEPQELKSMAMADNKQKTSFDKKITKGILNSISSIKKSIQYTKEIEIYNYVVNKGSKKGRNICYPRVVVNDYTLGLNDDGQIYTIF